MGSIVFTYNKTVVATRDDGIAFGGPVGKVVELANTWCFGKKLLQTAPISEDWDEATINANMHKHTVSRETFERFDNPREICHFLSTKL